MDYTDRLKEEIGRVERGCCFGVGAVETKIHLSNYSDWLKEHKPEETKKIRAINSAIEGFSHPTAIFNPDFQTGIKYCLEEFLKELEK